MFEILGTFILVRDISLLFPYVQKTKEVLCWKIEINLYDNSPGTKILGMLEIKEIKLI